MDRMYFAWICIEVSKSAPLPTKIRVKTDVNESGKAVDVVVDYQWKSGTGKKMPALPSVAPQNLTPNVSSAGCGNPFSLDGHQDGAKPLWLPVKQKDTNANNEVVVDATPKNLAPGDGRVERGTSSLVSPSANHNAQCVENRLEVGQPLCSSVDFDTISIEAKVEYLEVSAFDKQIVPASGLSGGLEELFYFPEKFLSDKVVTCPIPGEISTIGSGFVAKSPLLLRVLSLFRILHFSNQYLRLSCLSVKVVQKALLLRGRMATLLLTPLNG